MNSATMPAWDVELSRSELVRAAEADNDLPSWSARFLARAGAQKLVDALDQAVDDIVVQSNAIDADRQPHLWLLRIASRLGASVRVVREPSVNVIEPKTAEMRLRRTGWQRGILRLEDNNRWHILVGSSRNSLTRFDLAHELSHAILYRDSESIDIEAWKSTHWNAPEEACCNYAARRMMAPPSLVPMPSDSENLAVHIVDKIASKFCMPLRPAAFRYLDVQNPIKSDMREVAAISLWRQYHPLDRYFLIATLRHHRKLEQIAQEFAKSILALFPECSFQEAVSLWSAVGTGNAEAYFPDAVNRLTADMSRRLHALGTKRCEIFNERLVRRLPWCTFRPEWVAWSRRPNEHFIPLRVGSFREDTMISRLAPGSGPVQQRSEEDVSIGNLIGRFDIDGFGAGDPKVGHRYILQVLRKRS
jgi:hypothetical protein